MIPPARPDLGPEEVADRMAREEPRSRLVAEELPVPERHCPDDDCQDGERSRWDGGDEHVTGSRPIQPEIRLGPMRDQIPPLVPEGITCLRADSMGSQTLHQAHRCGRGRSGRRRAVTSVEAPGPRTRSGRCDRIRTYWV